MSEQYVFQLWQIALYDQFAETIPEELRSYAIMMLVIHKLHQKKEEGKPLTAFENVMLKAWTDKQKPPEGKSPQEVAEDDEILL